MQKTAGSPCPTCKAALCSEYAQIGKPARWTCHQCGSGGELIGDVSLRSKAKAAAPAPQVKRHWKA